jgi:hypothetical protein
MDQQVSHGDTSMAGSAGEVTRVDREDLTEAVRATALLADLTISTWHGELTDRKIGARIKDDMGAIGNTGKYVKNLMAGVDGSLKEVQAAYLSARALHYQLTLPWVTNPTVSDRKTGPRLLPNLLFDRYLTEMSKLRREAHRKLGDFIAEYPDLAYRARQNLAGMANVNDYPDPEDLRKRFKLSFDFAPIPSATAFQGLPDGMLERLGAQLKARQEAALGVAQAYMWERVRENVGHLIERLDDPGNKFKANTVDNVRELMTTLPGFNCTNDPRVSEIVADIDRMLEGTSPRMFRQSNDTRADVVRQARAINDKLSQWGL